MVSSISRRYIVVLVENRLGVLNRVASQIRKRNFNIESLTVSEIDTPGLSRITFVVDGETTNTEQVVKQLDKLINVIKVWDATPEKLIIRELLLLKVFANKESREEILQFLEAFQAKIHIVYRKSLVIELTDSPDLIDDFLAVMKDFGIIEMVRTGATVLNQEE
ncbi:acetolactate synthase small subunit [Candidatus Peregrinibacteria bacterium]|nr:acetolactate synthase small subunit [Candidatus Peregrinibacteria bacterium]